MEKPCILFDMETKILNINFQNLNKNGYKCNFCYLSSVQAAVSISLVRTIT
jgi:hypothetical protein